MPGIDPNLQRLIAWIYFVGSIAAMSIMAVLLVQR